MNAFQSCELCCVLTHCEHHGRCLALCLPADVQAERIAELEAENERLREKARIYFRDFERQVVMAKRAEAKLSEARAFLLTLLNESAQCPGCGQAVYKIPLDGHVDPCRLDAILKETE